MPIQHSLTISDRRPLAVERSLTLEADAAQRGMMSSFQLRMLSMFLIAVVAQAGCSREATPLSESQAVSGDVPVAVPVELVDQTVGGIRLVPRNICNGKLNLLLPADFTIMNEDMLRAKYLNDRRPTIVYTNETGAINVAVNHTQDRMPQDRLDVFYEGMQGVFKKNFPTATWFKSGVVEIKGRQWLTLNLRTPAVDSEIRNLMAGTSVDGRLLLVTVNFTVEHESEWLEPAESIIRSLQITP